MIKYALKCGNGHEYDAWFGSSSDYETQEQTGKLLCALCGTAEIGRAVMAPRIAGRKGEGRAVAPAEAQTPAETGEVMAPASPEMTKLAEAMREMRKQVEKDCDWVGKDFTEEARAMHYGEKDKRSIYGKASIEDAKALHDEGIAIAPLPFIADPDDVN